MPDENPEALFQRWLAEHGGAILKVARAYALTAEDGRDLVQEILLPLWRSPLASFEDETPGGGLSPSASPRFHEREPK